MTRLVLIRHGETDWNREGRWQGQADVALNAHGVAQAAQLAARLAGQYRLDAVYSSDLSRARHTAEIIAAAYGLPVHLDARLREIHQGEWQGLLVTEIEARYSQAYRQRAQDPWSVAPPGGETTDAVRRRVTIALNNITANHPESTVAVVSHGFTLAVARTLQGHSPAVDVFHLVPENCTPVILDWQAG